VPESRTPRDHAKAIAAKMADEELAALATEYVPKIRVEHQAAEAAFETAVARALRCGDILIEVKAKMRHGQWGPWVRKYVVEPGVMSERTERNYRRLAANRQQIANFKKVREAIDAVRTRRALPGAMCDDLATAQVSDVSEAVEGANRAVVARGRREAQKDHVPEEVLAESRGYMEGLNDALELVYEVEQGLRDLADLRRDVEGLRDEHRRWIEKTAGVSLASFAMEMYG
jgi:hypothetical protein